MSLEQYMAWCRGPIAELAEWEEGSSLREFSESVADVSSLLESLEPPGEVADWHYAVLTFQRAIGESLEDYTESGNGQSEDEFFLSILFPVAMDYQPAIDAAISGMDGDVRDRMVAVGCIDDDLAQESAPQIDTAELTVGETVEATADPDLGERYSFQAEQGNRFLIEVTGETLTYFLVTGPVTESQLPQSFISSGDDGQVSLARERLSSDTYFFQVVGEDVGTYTVLVRLDLSPLGPSNVRYVWDGYSIEVSWDPVDGADSYSVYHHAFFEAGCFVRSDGRPSFCDEVATNVVGTTFTHTTPDIDANYYWVIACNQEGCSETDPESPALPLGDGTGGPTSGGPCPTFVTLEEGDFCTVTITSIDVGTDRFEVRNGEGCFGEICEDESTILDEFIAYANRDGSWRITRAPSDTSSGSP